MKQPNTNRLKSPKQVERELINNYERNIQVLVSLTAIFDKFGGDSIIGKKLNIAQKDGYITPDLVTEMRYKSIDYGIISESKVSLPLNQDYWKDDFEQLQRYDKDLKGWDTSVQTHDILFVTDGIVTLKFWEYICSQGYQFIHKLAILESHREDKVNSFIDIKLVHGDKLTHKEVSREFEISQRVPLQNILREVDAIKFYDDHPPVVYTMGIIWQYVSSAKVSIEDYRRRKGFTTIPVEINIDELLEELRNRYAPSNNLGVLKKEWIREALDEFIKLGLAKRKLDKNYEIDIRRTIREWSPTNFLLDLKFDFKENKNLHMKRKGKREDKFQITIDTFMNNHSVSTS